MKTSIIWLARLGIDQGVFNQKAAWAVRMKLGEDAELVDFAQELLDGGYVDHGHVDALEQGGGGGVFERIERAADRRSVRNVGHAAADAKIGWRGGGRGGVCGACGRVGAGCFYPGAGGWRGFDGRAEDGFSF